MHLEFKYLVWAGVFLMGISCRNSPSEEFTNQPATEGPALVIVEEYHGNLPSPEFDSLVNHLTMYDNETFELHQVNRIAEHHLNEKDHKGIYAYLADSTQLGLYSMEGYLMLQFLITENGLVPLILDTEIPVDSSIIWKAW